jgi:hypothetical protein
MMRVLRYGAGWIAAHTVALPVLVLWLIAIGAHAIYDFAAWIVDDRRWTIWLLGRADVIEKWAKRP